MIDDLRERSPDWQRGRALHRTAVGNRSHKVRGYVLGGLSLGRQRSAIMRAFLEPETRSFLTGWPSSATTATSHP
jgi:hypothetical protein